MTVHSTQLGAKQGITTAGYTLYTVPSGKRTIWKGVTIYNASGSAQGVTIEVQLVDGDVIYQTYQLAAAGSDGDSINAQTWVVLNAGDSLAVSIAHNSVAVIVSGAELIL